MPIHLKLKELRSEKNVSVDKIAEYLKASPQSYYKYEDEITDPPLKKLKLLAKFFEVDLTYLLSDEINEVNNSNLKLNDKNSIDRNPLESSSSAFWKDRVDHLENEIEFLKNQLDKSQEMNTKLLVK